MPSSENEASSENKAFSENSQLTFQWLIQQDQQQRYRTAHEQQVIRLQEYLPASCRAAGWRIDIATHGQIKRFTAENYTYPMRLKEPIPTLSDITNSVLHASVFYEVLPLADLQHWAAEKPHYLSSYPDVLVRYNGLYMPPVFLPARFYFQLVG